MIVYQTDISGVFVGITTADQDPMDSKNMLIPAGCVETKPPSTLENQIARWSGSVWAVEDAPKPDTEPEEEPEDPAVVSRRQRDYLLASSDWTQLTDSPVNKSEWSTYRSLLRDVPKQSGFPSDIVWPTKP